MTHEPHRFLRRWTGPRIALATLAVCLSAWVTFDIVLRRQPPPPTILTGAAGTQQTLERWAPCCEVTDKNGVAMLVPSPERAALMPINLHSKYPLERAPGYFRFFIVGESSAANLGFYMVRSLSRDHRPDNRLQVVNCASGGSKVSQVRRRWEEVREYPSDGIVIMFGHNLGATETYLPRWRFRMNQVLSRSRLVVMLARRIAARRAKPPEETYPLLVNPSAYDSLLRSAADDAREKGRRLVFCTVALNMWYPPRVEPADLADLSYVKALFLHWRGRDAQAIAALKALIARDDRSPYWHFILGDWLFARGDATAAKRELKVAQVRFTNTATVSNGITRRVAAEKGVPVVETAALLERAMPDGIIDWRIMWDAVHVDPTGNRLVANACLKALGRPERFIAAPEETQVRRGRPLFTRLASAHATAGWFAPLEYTVWRILTADPDGEAIVREMITDEQLAPLAKTPSEKAALLCALSPGFWRAGRRDEALRLCDRAAREAPQAAGPRFLLGLYRLGQGRFAEAADAFDAAAKADPDDGRSAYFRDETRRLLALRDRR